MSLLLREKKLTGFFGYFVIFLISFFLFLSFQTAGKTFNCPDSFYHAKIASFLAEGKLIKNFPWLPFTILANNYSDHHFLYHLILVPFVKIFNNFLGIKIATLFFATSFILIFYWFLKKFKIKFPFFWTFLLLTSSTFLTRLNLAKVPPFALIILFFGLYALFKRKYFLLALISFVYVWAYNTWPILLVAVIIYCFSFAFKKLIDKWQKFSLNPKFEIRNSKQSQNPKHLFGSLGFRIWNLFRNWKLIIGNLIRYFFTKNNLKLILSCLAGIIIGLVVNPYFPQNLYFNWVHIVKIGLKNYQNILTVGVEWYPFEPVPLILTNLFVFVPWLVSIGWFFISFKKTKLLFSGQKTKTITLFILSFLFFLYTLKSRRNIEYFVPLAVSFSAFSLNRLFKNFLWKDYFAQFKNLKEFPYNLMSVILGAFILTIFAFALNSFLENIWQAKVKEFSGGWSFDKFKNVSLFLKENTKEGEIIFHSSWDEFPPLFYHNDKNYYIAGLDPTFMYEKDKSLYWIWQNITLGKQKKNLAKTIKEIFKSRYVFIRSTHEKMKENFEKDENFEEVYKDEEGVVYKIKK